MDDPPCSKIQTREKLPTKDTAQKLCQEKNDVSPNPQFSYFSKAQLSQREVFTYSAFDFAPCPPAGDRLAREEPHSRIWQVLAAHPGDDVDRSRSRGTTSKISPYASLIRNFLPHRQYVFTLPKMLIRFSSGILIRFHKV